MKKIIIGLLAILGIVFIVIGLWNGSGKEEQVIVGESEEAKVEVTSGAYIASSQRELYEGEGFLALNVTIQNNGEESMHFMMNNIVLYDEEGEQINAEYITPSVDNRFRILNTSTISAGKKASGYLVFIVDKEERYELHYENLSFGLERTDPIIIELDASDYLDTSKEAELAAEKYVTSIFLGGEVEDSDVEIVNDVQEEHVQFKQDFIKELENAFSDYNYSQEELEDIVDEYLEKLREEETITFEIFESSPNKAVVYVKPEVISLYGIDNPSNIIEDFEEDIIDGEQFLEELREIIQEGSMDTPRTMYGAGYRLLLDKEEDAWKIDTSSIERNDYEDLRKAIMGNLFY